MEEKVREHPIRQQNNITSTEEKGGEVHSGSSEDVDLGGKRRNAGGEHFWPVRSGWPLRRKRRMTGGGAGQGKGEGERSTQEELVLPNRRVWNLWKERVR